MISSWKEFFIAVEQMRECQKAYIREKNTASFTAAKTCETEVDEGIKKIRVEWARQAEEERNKGGAA